MAMARRAAVRDPCAMLRLTASQRQRGRSRDGRARNSSIEPVEPKGRVGLGADLRGHLSAWNQSSINKETLQGAPSERTFSAPYIVTVMHGIQLCSGSSRYRFRLSGLNNGFVLLAVSYRQATPSLIGDS